MIGKSRDTTWNERLAMWLALPSDAAAATAAPTDRRGDPPCPLLPE
jgi:hypothetical protein